MSDFQSNSPVNSQKSPQPASVPASPTISEEASVELRRLAHDLSNALEIIVQTSYLLSLVPLDSNGKEWLGMLEGGVNKSLELNNQLRSYLRTLTTTLPPA